MDDADGGGVFDAGSDFSSGNSNAPLVDPLEAAWVAQNLGNSTGVETISRGYEKLGRNALCPCGSGKKVKHCCRRPKTDVGHTGFEKSISNLSRVILATLTIALLCILAIVLSR